MQSVAICTAEMKLSAACPSLSIIGHMERYEKIVSSVTMYCNKLRFACLGAMPTIPGPLLVIVASYITGEKVSIARPSTNLTDEEEIHRIL
jgi:hypothetical protein